MSEIIVKIDANGELCGECPFRLINGFGECKCAIFDADLEYKYPDSNELLRAEECLNAETAMESFFGNPMKEMPS